MKRHAERTVGQAVPREHFSLMKGLPGRRRFCTGVAGRRNSRFDGRRDEYMTDTRTLSGEVARGESTVAPWGSRAGNHHRHQQRPRCDVVCWLLTFGGTVI